MGLGCGVILGPALPRPTRKKIGHQCLSKNGARLKDGATGVTIHEGDGNVGPSFLYHDSWGEGFFIGPIRIAYCPFCGIKLR